MASTSGRAPALTPSTPRARRRPPASTRCAASRGGGGYRSRASSTSLLRDPYRVLGVPDDATPEEIKLAYRRLTKATHPDVNPAKDAAETFRRVNAAYEILADTERRGRFDRGSDFHARDEGFAPERRPHAERKPPRGTPRRKTETQTKTLPHTSDARRSTSSSRTRRRDERVFERRGWRRGDDSGTLGVARGSPRYSWACPRRLGIGSCTASRRSPYGEGYSTVDSPANTRNATRRARGRRGRRT